jgi:hypothetical protein
MKPKRCPYYEQPFPGKKCGDMPCPTNTDIDCRIINIKKKKDGKKK